MTKEQIELVEDLMRNTSVLHTFRRDALRAMLQEWKSAESRLSSVCRAGDRLNKIAEREGHVSLCEAWEEVTEGIPRGEEGK